MNEQELIRAAARTARCEKQAGIPFEGVLALSLLAL
jgi:hypothetical protein